MVPKNPTSSHQHFIPNIGAFGVVVIAALYRQRARRIHRHMELGEDMSVGSQLQS